MSRVFKPGKFMNTHPYNEPYVPVAPTKKIREHKEGEDFHRVRTLSDWLFVKYDLTYLSYRRKSKNKRALLKKEFQEDTADYMKEIQNYYSEDYIKECDRMRLLALSEDFPYTV